MTPNQQAAYVAAQAAVAMIELEAMKVANTQREVAGEAPAYSRLQILALVDRYNIHHNAVISFFQEASHHA